MDLYTETIVDHFERPRHAGRLSAPDVTVQEDNVLCGDSLTLDCAFGKDGELSALAFTGNGCALSQASMSLLSEWALGKSCDEITLLSAEMVQHMLGSQITPARLKCALLGASALKRACNEYDKKED